MKLIELLVKELPGRGGFPEGANECVQDSDGTVKFFDSGSLSFNGYAWSGSARGKFYCKKEDKIMGLDLSCDYSSAIITRAQYEAALAANEGWAEWTGGECPVDRDAIGEVKYRIPEPYQYNKYNDRAGDFDWSHDGSNGDIIAYRLQNPGIDSRTNDDRLEQDLNECIGQDVDMPEWNGVGLPPAGCECEVKRAIDWVKCKILFISDAHVVLMADEECCWNTCACQFRPLRTEAEKLRDEAGLALYHAINWNSEGEIASPSRMEDYKKAYDAIAAGKIPGVKLEGK